MNPIEVNPYIAGNPVGGGGAFVGRAEVLREVLRITGSPNQNALVLYGQRRVGKISVLQELAARLPQEGAYYPIYFDLQDKASRSLIQVLEELAASIARRIDLAPPPAWGEEAPRLFREEFLPNALAHLPPNASLVLLFDEFDVLDNPSESQAGSAFFPYLRELIAQDLQRLNFLFVIGRRPEDLSSLTLSVFKGVKSQHVSLLPERETEALVRLAEHNGTLCWQDEASDADYRSRGAGMMSIQRIALLTGSGDAPGLNMPPIDGKLVQSVLGLGISFGA